MRDKLFYRFRKSKVAKVALFFLFISGCTPSYRLYESQFYGTFDTVVTIRGYARNEAAFTKGAEAAYERMHELHRLYDIYHSYENSNNLHTVNQHAGIAPVAVSQDIINMLLLAREGYDMTCGMVNVALGPVLSLWHDYRTEGLFDWEYAMLPPMHKLEAANKLTDIQYLIIDEENNTVFLQKPGMSLDVGSIAKAYAAGLALKAAEEAGLTSVIINAGGNIAAAGPPMDDRARWSIGVQNPDQHIQGTQNILDTVFFYENTLSCSGGYQRYYIVDDVAYGHIIDPATLLPADRYKQVAVVHPHAGLADILSTALFILPFDEGRELAEAHGAAVLWINHDGTWQYTDNYARISKEISAYSSVDK